MRSEEMSWDKVRRAQMRWSVECEGCSVKCGAWRVQCEVWSVKCEVWTVKCGVWSVKSGLWSVKCGVWSVKCGVCSGKRAVWSVECEVWSVKCEVWSAQCAECSVKSAVCSVECEDCQVWSVTWSFKCDMWNKTPVSQSARTHGLRWRTAHASSIDEKGLIYIFKATSAPPRAGTTGSLPEGNCINTMDISHDYNNSGFSCHHVQKTYLKTGYTPSSLPLKYPTLIPSKSPLIAYWWLTQFVSGLQPQSQTDIAPTYPTYHWGYIPLSIPGVCRANPMKISRLSPWYPYVCYLNPPIYNMFWSLKVLILDPSQEPHLWRFIIPFW